MKIRNLAAAMSLAVSLLAGCQPHRIRMGTAGEGGVYGRVGEAFAKEMSGMEIRVDHTAGSAANLRLLSDEYIQLGIAQADVIDELYNGELKRGYSAVAGLYTESVHIIVAKNADIESVDDLAGKKVSIGAHESGTERNAEQILSVYGLDGMVMTENMDYEEARNAILAGDIDAMFVTAGAGAEIIEGLAESELVEFLSLDNIHRGRLLQKYPFYQEVTIPAGTYDGEKNSILTVGVESVLVASDTLSDALVNKVTKTLFEKRDVISEESGIELDLDAEMKGLNIPVHPGAKTYYESSKGGE